MSCKQSNIVAFIVLFLNCVLIRTSEGANILGLFPTTSRSHFIIEDALMRGLAEKGHNVTVVSAFHSDGNALPNYHEVHLDMEMPPFMKEWLSDTVRKPGSEKMRIEFMPKVIGAVSNRSVDMLLHPKMQAIMHSGQTFDLMILGWFLNDFLLGVGAHFQCPTAVVITLHGLRPVRNYVGNPAAVSSVPCITRGHDEAPMTFWRRLLEFLMYAAEYLADVIFNYIYELYYNEHFPASKNYPSFDKVRENVSLVLVNSHFSQGKPRPLVPNMVEISGIQLKEKPDPLPEELQNFIDSAEHGVILFAFGSNAKFAEMNATKRTDIFSAISKLKQKVILKWESDTLPEDLPKNALARKWLPQGDILGNPKTRLFISHCGLGSINEAQYHGVPILAIPLFADQFQNTKVIVAEGWAVPVPFEQLNEPLLSKILNEMLSNATYTNIVKSKSMRYRDRPMSALDSAVFWVEYVIRHNGARHLKSDAAYMNMFQQNSLDVIAFLVIVLIVIWKILKFVVVKSFKQLKKVFTTRKVKTN